MKLADRVALVTGGGSGIGRAICRLFAEEGATVLVNDIDPAAAEATVKMMGRGRALPADVADSTQVAAMFAAVAREHGGLDILVNNAGIVRDGSIFNMSVDDFDAVMKVHVRGTWLPSKAAALHWRAVNKETGAKVGGRIINTVSGAGLVGNFGQTNYAPAKAAIASLTQTLSLELYRIGVTVNAIGPAGATRITATMPGALGSMT